MFDRIILKVFSLEKSSTAADHKIIVARTKIASLGFIGLAILIIAQALMR